MLMNRDGLSGFKYISQEDDLIESRLKGAAGQPIEAIYC